MAEDLTTQQLAGVVMAQQALLGALLATLLRKDVLPVDEIRETFDRALLMLEESRGTLPAVTVEIDVARTYLEAQLRTLSARR